MSRGRYEALDSDEHRLPENVERIGYDADTQTYTYRDNADGTIWEGEEGNRYGQLHRVGSSSAPPPFAPEITPRTRYEDWRYLAPWLVIVVVVLLLVFRLVNSGGSGKVDVVCSEGLERYTVASGESCWSIAKDLGWSLDELRGANGGVECEQLRPGDVLCVRREA